MPPPPRPLDRLGRAAGPARGRPRVLPGRSVHLSITLAIVAALVLYARRPAAPYSPARALPPTYAVCTPGRRGVYTVPPGLVALPPGADDDDDDSLGAVECVLVAGKYVVDAGPLDAVRRAHAAGPASSSRAELQVIALPPGHTVTPGLIDAHAHPLAYGHSRALDLRGARSVAEAVARVEAVAAAQGEGWVEGLGWDQNLWPGGAFPTAADLDTPALRGRAVALKRIDVHAELVSPAVLALLGPLPASVPGGQIVRDAAGAPTGVFIDNAVDLIDAVRPAWTDAQRARFLAVTAADTAARGMTGLHDAGVRPDDLRWFRAAAERGELPMRFYTMILCEDREAYCGDTEMVFGAGDDKLTIRAVKLFGDGALGSRGAALLDDYTDSPGSRGFMLAPDDSWAPTVKRYYDDGWQVNVHCIGDRANQVVLDAIEGAVGRHPGAAAARRLRIEHAQIMTPADLARAAKLGVIASYQPTHATSDMWYAEDRLGAERMRGAYAWQTYLSHGGRVALGSDFPVESPDPLRGLYAAVTRRAEAGDSPHGPAGWFRSERLSRAQALRGFTADAAYAAFSNTTGSLVGGCRADLVVWAGDLASVPARDMLAVRVVATLIDGQVVHGALDGGRRA